MELLSWTTLTPTCKVHRTEKRYHNRYLYKAVFRVPASRILLNNTVPVATQLDTRKYYVEQSIIKRWGGFPWSARQLNIVKEAKIEQLEHWRNIVHTRKTDFRFRVEEPWLSVYACDEQKLYDLAATDKDSLLQVYRPETEEERSALELNEVITRTPNEYDYKIFLREGYKLTDDQRRSIGTYLLNLDNEVKLTNGVLKNFSEEKWWFNGTYFYARDESVITFLNLMAPGIVTGIFKLRYIPR